MKKKKKKKKKKKPASDFSRPVGQRHLQIFYPHETDSNH